MFVKLGRIVIHDLLRNLQGIVMWESRLNLFVRRLGLLVRMVVDEEVLDAAGTDGALVDREAGGKFTVLANANLLQKVHGEVLTVVVDKVVSRSLFLHVEDCHFA